MSSSSQDSLIHQAELVISNVLRWGVFISAFIMFLGLGDFYLQYLTRPSFSALSHPYPHDLAALGTGLTRLDPAAIMVLGLLLLLATPVLRVAVSIVAFGLERDWRYVGITALVLFILVMSFLFGKGGA